jgi:hypothetical protein
LRSSQARATSAGFAAKFRHSPSPLIGLELVARCRDALLHRVARGAALGGGLESAAFPRSVRRARPEVPAADDDGGSRHRARYGEGREALLRAASSGGEGRPMADEKAALIRKGRGGQHLSPWLPGGDHKAARSLAVQGWAGGSWGQTEPKGIRGAAGFVTWAEVVEVVERGCRVPGLRQAYEDAYADWCAWARAGATAPVTRTGLASSATPTTSGTGEPAPPFGAPPRPSSTRDAPATSTGRRCSEPRSVVQLACNSGRRSRVNRGLWRSTAPQRGKAPTGA